MRVELATPPQDVTNERWPVSLNSSAVATAGPASVNVLPGPPASLTFTTQPTDTLVDDCINNPGCRRPEGASRSR